MTSHLFPVSCFWSRGFVPSGSEISRFWYIKTRGRKIAVEYIFCYTYQYIEEILSSKFKKICHIHLNVPLLKGHCHAIWQPYKKLEGVFASIEIQN